MKQQIDYIKLRNLWFDFFTLYDHSKLESANLITSDNDSLLWTNSGVAGIKKYFTLEKKPPSKKLVNIQKCLRTNDLSNVGVTLRHHTFFEMMGFFSIGDYFKKNAIEMSWEFLTSKKWLGIDKNKLFVTIFSEDLESEDIWLNTIKIKKNHLIKCGKKINFWQIGKGPCGPNTEIFYDRGKKFDLKNIGTNLLKENIENDRFLEIWNIVFSELYFDGIKTYKQLPSKNIDAGIGYERLLSVLENKTNNFDISLFSKIKDLIFARSSFSKKIITNNENIIIVRKICDFSRAITFIISEGVEPSNKDRGYILKNLLKKTIFCCVKLNICEPIIKDLIYEYQYIYKKIYPNLSNIDKHFIDIIVSLEASIFKKNEKLFAINQKIKYILKKSQKQTTFWKLEEFEYKANIFDQVAYMYIPSKRFIQYETHGEWSEETKDYYQYYFQFLKIPYYESYNFSILMPPPNITGKLHLGHSLELYIQDILVKENKFLGKDVLFTPGLDHAGIASQIIINKEIQKQYSKSIAKIPANSVNNFVKLWENTQKNNIIDQWKSIGINPTWNMLNYTFNDKSKKYVLWAFKKLYENKLIYKAKKIVNWDTSLKTAISDIEINYLMLKKQLYNVKYFFEKSTKHIIIATTRPETIFADTAVFVNSNDKRYKNLIGKSVINPLSRKNIKIYGDSSVDKDFGTGILKCTPNHDFFDYELAKKYKLDFFQCIDKNGNMVNTNKLVINVDGLKVLDARKKVVEYLKKNNYIKSVSEYESSTPYSQRSNTIIEPYISNQWFVKLKDISSKISVIQNKFLPFNIFPATFNKKYQDWINNIHDWCISRQISWGHKIPVWYDNKTNEIIAISNKKPNNHSYQDSDVLDTWFSSALWPLITLDYLSNSNIFSIYYPYTTLVTGYDILFFWVCRMNLLCSYLIHDENKVNKYLFPFKNILLHGLVRDKFGKKMSKSNNNGIDPLVIIKKYGTEPIRLFFALNHTPGLDINFHEEKIKELQYLPIKITNAYNFINIWEKKLNYKIHQDKSVDFIDCPHPYISYMICDFKKFIITAFNRRHDFITKYPSCINSVKYHNIINFFIKNFCSNYLEALKFLLSSDSIKVDVKIKILKIFSYIYNELLILLNPVLPITTFDIFNKLNQKIIYDYKNIFFPSRFYNLGKSFCLNFSNNKNYHYKNTYVHLENDFDNEVTDLIYAKISEYKSKNQNDYGVYFYIKTLEDYNTENITFLQAIYRKWNISIQRKDIIYKYNVLDKYCFQSVVKIIYNPFNRIGNYTIFHGYFTQGLLDFLSIYINELLVKMQNEAKILGNKILNLQQVLLKNISDSKNIDLNKKISLFQVKKDNTELNILRIKNFGQKFSII